MLFVIVIMDFTMMGLHYATNVIILVLNVALMLQPVLNVLLVQEMKLLNNVSVLRVLLIMMLLTV